MEDFFDKKQQLVDVLESFTKHESSKNEVLDLVSKFKSDEDFKGKDLFSNLFNELENYIDELSRKELKQRILLISSYMD